MSSSLEIQLIPICAMAVGVHYLREKKRKREEQAERQFVEPCEAKLAEALTKLSEAVAVGDPRAKRESTQELFLQQEIKRRKLEAELQALDALPVPSPVSLTQAVSSNE